MLILLIPILLPIIRFLIQITIDNNHIENLDRYKNEKIRYDLKNMFYIKVLESAVATLSIVSIVLLCRDDLSSSCQIIFSLICPCSIYCSIYGVFTYIECKNYFKMLENHGYQVPINKKLYMIIEKLPRESEA